jgi:hypothetical protein
VDARFTAPGADRPISADEVHELEKLIDDNSGSVVDWWVAFWRRSPWKSTLGLLDHRADYDR